MLKITESSNSAPKELQANDEEIIGGGSDDKNLSKSKKSKNAKSRIQTHNKIMGEPIFLTSNTKEAFNLLR